MYPNKRSKKSPDDVKKGLGASLKGNRNMVQRRRAQFCKYNGLAL